jgi:sterol desaturase/sphingolipid hydroxylase (fatty acid hydroxylase superfamily)
MGGVLIGYVIYDCSHYWEHHCNPTIKYFKDMQEFHMDHHYVAGEGKYGITNTFWDWVFNTTDKIPAK